MSQLCHVKTQGQQIGRASILVLLSALQQAGMPSWPLIKVLPCRHMKLILDFLVNFVLSRLACWGCSTEQLVDPVSNVDVNLAAGAVWIFGHHWQACICLLPDSLLQWHLQADQVILTGSTVYKLAA